MPGKRLGSPLAPAALLAAAGLMLPAAEARAHPRLDEGRRLFEEADFAGALDALGRAEAATDLSQEELALLFETRAQVRLAMGDTEGMRADLARLVAVAPDHALPRAAPPDVQRALAEVRSESGGAPRLLASTEAAAAGVTIVVRVENDWAGVVREVRIAGRTRGATTWQRARDAPLLVTGADLVEYHAEAIGPGGVVLARAGTEAEPLLAAGDGADGGPGGGGGVEAWPFLVAGAAALLVAGAIVVAVVVAQSGSPASTQPEPFTVRF